MIPTARSTGNQLSSRLLSMHTANALLLLPERSTDKQQLKHGEIVDAIVIGRIY
jgi:gephyrin